VSMTWRAMGLGDVALGDAASNICPALSQGYSRVSTDYECGECPSPGINFVTLLALGAIVVFVIAYLVTQTLKKKVGEKRHEDASILKVMLNYFQVVSFAAVIEFRWPAFMRDTLVAGPVIRSLFT